MNPAEAETRRLCVDACLAAQWVIAESLSPKALALYRQSRTSEHELVVPPLLAYEVTNAIFKRTWRPLTSGVTIGVEQAQALLRELDLFEVVVRSYPAIHEDALGLAHEYGLKSSHDAHYLALARHLGCDLWTADQRLWNALRDHVDDVFWLGDYPL